MKGGARQRKQTLRKDVGSGVVDQLTECFATMYEALDSIPTLRKPGVVIMFVILALERWTQADQRFVVILCYMVISSPAWTI